MRITCTCKQTEDRQIKKCKKVNRISRITIKNKIIKMISHRLCFKMYRTYIDINNNVLATEAIKLLGMYRYCLYIECSLLMTCI